MIESENMNCENESNDKTVNYGIYSDFLNVFGPDFDRLDFPGDIHWVAAGCGGNGILINGSTKSAVIDCGMAYCGAETAANIRKYTDHLDYIICSHSHYDHIGAIPYILDEFPSAAVCGSEKCSKIFQREGARRFMKEMGINARDIYDPGSKEDIRTDNLHVDVILHEGDIISLGREKIKAYETKGHTDCSLSFLLQSESLLFASESTGILEAGDYIHTPVLKSFDDAFNSIDKCRNIGARHVCLPHFGLIPESFNETYFRKYEAACKEKISYVKSMIEQNTPENVMQEEFIERYKIPSGEKLQPFKAYAENARHILSAILRYIDEKETEGI